MTIVAALCLSCIVQFEYGNAFTRPGGKYNTQVDMQSVVIRNGGWWVSQSIVYGNGRAVSGGVVFESKNSVTPQFRAGVAHISNPDAVYISGHWQADVFIGIKMHQWAVGWRHFSNCKHICRSFLKKSGPNIGFDWLAISYSVQY